MAFNFTDDEVLALSENPDALAANIGAVRYNYIKANDPDMIHKLSNVSYWSRKYDKDYGEIMDNYEAFSKGIGLSGIPKDDNQNIVGEITEARELAAVVPPVTFSEGLGGAVELGKGELAQNMTMLGISDPSTQTLVSDKVRQIKEQEDLAQIVAQTDPEQAEAMRFGIERDQRLLAGLVASNARGIKDFMTAQEDIDSAVLWNGFQEFRETGEIPTGVKGFSEFLGGILVSQTVAQLPTIAKTAVSGPLAPATVFKDILNTERSAVMIAHLKENDVDFNDQESLRAAINNEQLMKAAANRGMRKAFPVALFSALSAGYVPGGKTLLGKLVKEGSSQAAFDALGEGIGGLAETGSVDLQDIFIEVLAGTAQTAGEGVAKITTSMVSKNFKKVASKSDGVPNSAEDWSKMSESVSELEVLQTLETQYEKDLIASAMGGDKGSQEQASRLISQINEGEIIPSTRESTEFDSEVNEIKLLTEGIRSAVSDVEGNINVLDGPDMPLRTGNVKDGDPVDVRQEARAEKEQARLDKIHQEELAEINELQALADNPPPTRPEAKEEKLTKSEEKTVQALLDHASGKKKLSKDRLATLRERAKGDIKVRRALDRGAEKLKRALFKKDEKIANLKEKMQQKVNDARVKTKQATDKVKKRYQAALKKADERLQNSKAKTRQAKQAAQDMRRSARDAIKQLEALSKELNKLLPKDKQIRISMANIPAKPTLESLTKALDKAVDRINSVFEDSAKRADIAKVDKALKKFEKNKKLPKELEVTRTIREVTEMNLEDVSKEADDILSNEKLSESDLERLNILNIFGGIANRDEFHGFTVARTNAAVAELEYMTREGRGRVKARKEAEAKANAERKDKIIKELGYGSISDLPTSRSMRKEQAKWYKRYAKSAVAWVAGRNDNLEFLFENVKRVKGRFTGELQDFYQRIIDSKDRVNQRNFQMQEDMRVAVQEAIDPGGKMKPREMHKLLESWGQEESSGIRITEEGVFGEVEISRWEAISMYMQLQDKSLHSTFEKMLKGSDIDTFTKEVKEFIGEAGSSVGDSMLEMYRKHGLEYQKVVRDVDGYTPFVVENYSPISRRYNQADTNQNIEDATNMDALRIATEKNSHTKERSSNTRELIFKPANEVVASYLYKMNHFLETAQIAKDIRSTFKDSDVRKGIQNNAGTRDILDQLDRQLDAVIRGGLDPALIDNWVSKVSGGIAVSKIALNPVSAFKQFASIPAYADSIPAVAWTKQTAKMWSSPKEIKTAIQTILDTTYIRDRLSSGQTIELKALANNTENMRISGKNSWRDRVMIMTRFADVGAIVAGGWPVYKYHLEQNAHLGPEQAKKIAEKEFVRATARAQQDANAFSMSYWQLSGSMGKLFQTFLTSPIQYQRHVNEAIRSYMTKLPDGQRKRGAMDIAKTIGIYHVVLPQLFQAMGSAFVGLWSDDEEIEEKFWDRQLKALIFGNANSIFLIGQFIDAFGSIVISGEDMFFADGSIPILQQSEKATKSAIKFAQAEEFSEAAWEIMDLVGNLSSFYGVPYDPIKSKFETAMEVDWEEDYSLLRYLGFSEYSLGMNAKPKKKKKRKLFQH